MKKHHIALYALFLLLLSTIVYSCKTTENNYRQAYERTMARDSARTDFTQTVYGRYRSQVAEVPLEYAGDTITARRTQVTVTTDGGATRDSLHQYCVVAGEFKQLFNAKSMQERLVNSGLSGAFVVQNREPYYYVLAGSFRDFASALALRNRLQSAPPFALRSPAPYILIPTVYFD